jgi:tRNA modification GTPase
MGVAVLSSAVLTPAGRGAVATISVQGPEVALAEAIDRHFVAANGRPLADQPHDRICFGSWTSESDASLKDAEVSDPEEVVVQRRDEETVEVCCHGGPTAVERILSDLRQLRIATVPWHEQIAAASTSLEAELQDAVTRATTRRTALKLLEQQSILPVEFARLEQLAASLLSSPKNSEANAKALSMALAEILKWASFGLHLTGPWRVVLAGRPNVGKSTLMNALAGFDRAIVYDTPGTTRDVVSVETALDGWPLELLDTAGIRDATSEIEREGVSRSRRALDEADCVCLLLDAGSSLTAEDRQLIAEVAASRTPAIFVASKSDLDRVWKTPLAELNEVSVSAVNEIGIDQLIEAIVRQLVPEEPPAGVAVPVTVRQVNLLTTAGAAADLGDWAAALAELEKLNRGKDGKHGKE